MFGKYENRKYLDMGIKHRMISNITRKCDVFTLYRSIGGTKDVDYRTALNALVGLYYHFLISGGYISRKAAVAADPSLICLNITINEKKGGEPVLTLQESIEYLGYLLHGLYCFHNKKCRNTAVMQGMAYIIRKLYEPYMDCRDSYIHEIYYAIIARGALSSL